MNCKLCHNPKPIKVCGLCGADICKNCTNFLEKEHFRFLPEIPKVLQSNYFCHDCYQAHVLPEKQKYDALLDTANELVYLSKKYRGIIPVLRRAKKSITVKNHTDKKEAVQHLKFLAALSGFNAIIKGEVDCKKIRHHAFEKKEWFGDGLPAELDLKKLERLRED